MDNCKANQSIACSVQQCRYHCGSQNYCSLDKIQMAPMKRIPPW